jgi:hypothetical protein
MATDPEVARMLPLVAGTSAILLARHDPAAGPGGFIVLTHHSALPARELRARGRSRVFGLSPRLLRQGTAMRAWVMRNFVVDAAAGEADGP